MNNSVIVYRNPLEQWMWESGAVAWIGIGLALIVVVGSAIAFVKEMRNTPSHRRLVS